MCGIFRKDISLPFHYSQIIICLSSAELFHIRIICT